MRSTTLLITGILIAHLTSKAQPAGQWTWMSGDSAWGSIGYYGMMGVPSANNYPPGIYSACEWTDLSGNFWFYGGYHLDTPFPVEQSAMWRYDLSTNEWTWMNGSWSSGVPPVYGTKGVSSPSNTPGSRAGNMLSWVDVNGNLWMYGGGGFTGAYARGDLWKYDIGTNEWTWMSGTTVQNSMGNYGTIGVPSVLNHPPALIETACAWTEGNNLWLYGGETYYGLIGSLWRYSISTDEWTWMKGDSALFAPGWWGLQGQSLPANFPGARSCYSRWKDLNGDFWIYGGNNYNDLWRYSPATNEWTWMSGPYTTNDNGSYWNHCVPYGRPASRHDDRATWTDSCGMFWIFGGETTQYGRMNDLWKYDPVLDEWTWIDGNDTGNTPGSYGVKGVSSWSNNPGSRENSNAFMDANGNLWLFGGMQYRPHDWKSLGDLWRFVPDPNCGGCGMNTSVYLNNSEASRDIFIPNPASDKIKILAKGIVIIFDNLGHKVFEEKIEFEEEEIYIPMLGRGIYIVQIQEGNKVRQQKLVKM